MALHSTRSAPSFLQVFLLRPWRLLLLCDRSDHCIALLDHSRWYWASPLLPPLRRRPPPSGIARPRASPEPPPTCSAPTQLPDPFEEPPDAGAMSSKRVLPITFGAVTEKNVEQLKVLNRAIFPINYNERVYKDILAFTDVTQLAYHNDVLVGAIACRLEKSAQVRAGGRVGGGLGWGGGCRDAVPCCQRSVWLLIEETYRWQRGQCRHLSAFEASTAGGSLRACAQHTSVLAPFPATAHCPLPFDYSTVPAGPQAVHSDPGSAGALPRHGSRQRPAAALPGGRHHAAARSARGCAARAGRWAGIGAHGGCLGGVWCFV